MAIVNDNNNYLKVTDVIKNQIKFSVYKNVDVRRNLTDFDVVKEFDLECNIDFLNVVSDSTKSIKENMITQAYKQIKQDSLYSGWIDLV